MTINEHKDKIKELEEKITYHKTQINNLNFKNKNTIYKNIDNRKNLFKQLKEKQLNAKKFLDEQKLIFIKTENDKKQAEALIEIHKKIEKLSIKEIKERDAILNSILEINKLINTLQSTKILIDKTLLESMKLLNVKRGIIALKKERKILIKAKKGFSKDTPLSDLTDKMQYIFDILKKNSTEFHNEKQFIVSPITKELNQVGLIYLEKPKNKNYFRKTDHEFLDIFASQVSLAFNNSLLFNRVKMQNREMKKMIMLKNNFIEHLSVDLKKSLNELFKIMMKIEPSKKSQKASTLIKWLLNVIDKLISTTALEEETEEMYDNIISIDEIINNIIKTFEATIEEKQLNIKINQKTKISPIEANKEIINTILDEIICNAIVYNTNHGSININIEEEDQNIFITISDTGVGISQEDKKKIFHRFYRAKTSYSLYDKGAGLGLYIAKKFTETYGGKLTLSSSLGLGTVVNIKLPI